MRHSDEPIVFHPQESSGIDYNGRADLIFARIKVFKKMYGFLGGLFGGMYILLMHYTFYKKYFSVWEFVKISRKALWD